MTNKRGFQLYPIFLIVIILYVSICVVSATLNESVDDLGAVFSLNSYKANTTLDTGVAYIINSTNYEKFPQELYYRNGTIAGWLINGTFATEFPYDIWIRGSWNSTWC